MSMERTLATFAHAPVPASALSTIRLCMFDWAVCAHAGMTEPLSVILRNKAKHEAGLTEALIFGGAAVPAPRAALANGAISHALDFDDTHFGHIGHTSVAVMPAVVAVAQKVGASMAQAQEAALIGSEAAVRIGQWLGRNHYQIGFHQTATSGAFGATLAAMRLLEGTAEQTITALGLVASRAAGLKAQFGTMAKPLNAGLAAEAGVEAALWAIAGLTASQTGITAFGETHHGLADETAFDDLGNDWRIETVSHKFHACCHGLHAMLEAMDVLGATAQHVETIAVRTHPRWMTVCGMSNPTTGLETKFSFRAAAAMKLMGLDTGKIGNFSDENATHSGLLALRDRVIVATDKNVSETQSRVDVTLKGGKKVSAQFDLSEPMPLSERTSRLKTKAAGMIGPNKSGILWTAVQSGTVADLF